MNVVKVSEAMESNSFPINSARKEEKFNINQLAPAQKRNETQNTDSTNTRTTTAKISLASSTIYIPNFDLEHQLNHNDPSLDFSRNAASGSLALDMSGTVEKTFDLSSTFSTTADLKPDVKKAGEEESTEYASSTVMITSTNPYLPTQIFGPNLSNNEDLVSETTLSHRGNNPHYAEEASYSYNNVPEQLIPNTQPSENDLPTEESHPSQMVKTTSINLTNTYMEDVAPQKKSETLNLEHAEVTTSVESRTPKATPTNDLPKELQNVIDQNASELADSKFQVKVLPKDGKNLQIDHEAEVKPTESAEHLENNAPTTDITSLKTEAIEKNEEEFNVQRSTSDSTQEVNDGTEESRVNTEASNIKSFATESDTKVDEVARAVTSQTIDGIGKHFQTSLSSKSLQIQLDPIHLGKVDIQISTLDDGSIHAKFIVENKETLQILARDSSQIEQALKDNMLDNRNVQIDFATAQDGHYDGQQSQEKFDAHQANQIARAKEGYGAHPADSVREYVRHTTLGYNIKA